MTKRLAAKVVRYAMGQNKKGTSMSAVAVQIDVTHKKATGRVLVYQIAIHFQNTEAQTIQLSPDEVQMILDEHE